MGYTVRVVVLLASISSLAFGIFLYFPKKNKIPLYSFHNYNDERFFEGFWYLSTAPEVNLDDVRYGVLRFYRSQRKRIDGQITDEFHGARFSSHGRITLPYFAVEIQGNETPPTLIPSPHLWKFLRDVEFNFETQTFTANINCIRYYKRGGQTYPETFKFIEAPIQGTFERDTIYSRGYIEITEAPERCGALLMDNMRYLVRDTETEVPAEKFPVRWNPTFNR